MRPVFKDSELLIGSALNVTYERENATQPYVSVPPALIVTDSNGATWTLGFEYLQKNGQFYFNVLRNDKNTGEFASNIEYRKGRIRIRCSDGTMKTWTERPQGSKSLSPGYWV